MGAPQVPLATLEVAVGSGCRTLPRVETIIVHRQAHGAARIAPLEPGGTEDLVEPLRLRLRLDQSRARHGHGLGDAVGDVPPVQNGRRRAQILDPTVGAGADEHPVDRNRCDRPARLQVHVGERSFAQFTFGRVLEVVGCRDVLVDTEHEFGRRSPSDLGNDSGGVEFKLGVEIRVRVRYQRTPIVFGPVPHRAGGSEGASVHVVQRGVVHRHESGPRPGFDGHVAQRHPRLHGKCPNRAARVLDGMSGSARRADGTDNGQDHVLGTRAERQVTVHDDPHVAAFALHQALRRQNKLNFGGADAVCQCRERAMGGGVRVAANDCHARKRCALFRTDNVDDALAPVRHLELFDAVALAVVVQDDHLLLRNGILDTFNPAAAVGGRDVVVGRRQVCAPPPGRASRLGETLERLGRRDLVQEVSIDVEDRHAIVAFGDDVGIPDLVVDGPCGHRSPEARQREREW